MNCFKLPKGTCEEINSVIANYWWSKGTCKRSMHWVAWNRMGISKNKGGLGFRDIECFNLALLGKQVWRLLQAPDSLTARILKGRYYSDTNILNAGPGNKPSFIWKSLLEGRNLLRKGLRFLIGNGNETNASLDPWLPTDPPRPPRFLDDNPADIIYVKDLIDTRTKLWNREVLERSVAAEDINHILRLKLSSTTSPDLLGWHYTDSGLYTVKSGYHFAINITSIANNIQPPRGQVEFKKTIWTTFPMEDFIKCLTHRYSSLLSEYYY